MPWGITIIAKSGLNRLSATYIVESEAGEYYLALEQGVIQPSHIKAELGDLLLKAELGDLLYLGENLLIFRGSKRPRHSPPGISTISG
ncbi:hypothetical protein ccbrp13_14820 [Ktedonobacteria bacterium brp13]|nr:hypothetical protein ccbrp13_14820 [Ktedonobacteria bacterium brp13]